MSLNSTHYIGCSGIGALLAQTLALRNVTVVVLDLTLPKDPIENGKPRPYARFELNANLQTTFIPTYVMYQTTNKFKLVQRKYALRSAHSHKQLS